MAHSPDDDFPALLQAVADGDQAAAQVFYDRFAPRLHRAIRRFLNQSAPKLRTQYDSLDFVQETFYTFLKSHVKGRSLEHPKQAREALLHAYLAKTAIRHVLNAMRAHHSDKRDDLHGHVSLSDRSARDLPLISLLPSASDLLQVAETLKLILMDLPPFVQRIVNLKSRGYSIAEIATILKLDERTVRRFLDAIVLPVAV